MTWHVITRVGNGDSFTPELSSQDPRLETSLERTDDRWQVGNDLLDRLQKLVKSRQSGVAIDLAYLAMAVYTADLRIPRRFASDRWTREIAVHLPCGDLAFWSAAVPQFAKTLNFLTGDRWQINVRARERPYPETDGPFVKPNGLAQRPPDVSNLLCELARIWGIEPTEAKRVVSTNLDLVVGVAED